MGGPWQKKRRARGLFQFRTVGPLDRTVTAGTARNHHFCGAGAEPAVTRGLFQFRTVGPLDRTVTAGTARNHHFCSAGAERAVTRGLFQFRTVGPLDLTVTARTARNHHFCGAGAEPVQHHRFHFVRLRPKTRSAACRQQTGRSVRIHPRATQAWLTLELTRVHQHLSHRWD